MIGVETKGPASRKGKGDDRRREGTLPFFDFESVGFEGAGAIFVFL